MNDGKAGDGASVDPLDRFIELDKERRRREATERQDVQVITMQDYLKMVRADPKISQNAHDRQLEIILADGQEGISEDEQWVLGADTRYPFFARKLFGTEASTAEFISYLKTGAARLSTARQIPILVGPTASGKSTFVRLMARALEAYHAHPVYTIQGCPMHEDPLNLLPRFVRRSHWDAEKAQAVGFTSPIEEELGVSEIEGDLCHHCRTMLLEDYKDADGDPEWWRVKVERFTFSVQAARGIGSFEPSDEKSQDVGDLVGHENIGITSNPKYGRNHRDSYWMDGELCKGNRGITEMSEILKSGIDERILWVLINVGEERQIKVQGSSFPRIGVDTLVVGHCNLKGFKEFAADQKNEALHDRFLVIPFPYPVRVRDEVRLYEKLIRTESDMELKALRSCHIPRASLVIAATFSILTRLTPSQMGVDPLTKLKIYNGEEVLVDLEKDKDRKPIDVLSLKEEGQPKDDVSKREGMFGVSPRDVLAALNLAIADEGETGCLTPANTIKALREVFRHRMGYTPEELKSFEELLTAGEHGSVISEYNHFVIEQVSKAFLEAYEDLAREQFNKYMEEAERSRELKRRYVKGDMRAVKRDTLTDKPKEPDLKLLRAVEERIPIPESGADIFRGEVLEYRGSHSDFGYDTYPVLRHAVEENIIQGARASLVLVLAKDKPRDQETSKRAKDLMGALLKQDFCKICGAETVERATELLHG